MGSKVNLGSLGILQKRAGFVSFQRHTVLVLLILPAQPQDLILLQFLLLLLILPAQPQDLILLQFLLLLLSSSSFFFFFFLSTSLFLLQLTWYDHVTQVIFISLMTATKLMGLEIHLGSFGVTGVKKVNHVKNMKTALI